jgi:hypothetical protein
MQLRIFFAISVGFVYDFVKAHAGKQIVPPPFGIVERLP